MMVTYVANILDEQEYMFGYQDGRDSTCPEPSANRSWCYRHSFAIGRQELAGKPVLVQAARRSAELVRTKDAGV